MTNFISSHTLKTREAVEERFRLILAAFDRAAAPSP
jgi:hypothetical protein